MKTNGPSMRRQRDAKRAPAAPKQSPSKDKTAEIVEESIKEEEPLPEMEKGRPKDTGRMGA